MEKIHGRPVVLVVDDSFTSRALLKKALSTDFEVIEVDDGRRALEVLSRRADVAAIVLDIQMPELDGYGVLIAMMEDERLRSIPVIVCTGYDDVESQIAALDHGAVDVLVKPFNPQVTLARVRNVIVRREVAQKAALAQALEQMLEQADIDEKTGLLDRRAFCRKTTEAIKTHPDRAYVVLLWDVDRFKVFNEVFGVEAGDAFISEIGSAINARFGSRMICGYWGADRFLVCMTREQMEKDHFVATLEALVADFRIDFEFVLRIGVYEIDEPDISAELMCDRALLALRSTKGDYATRMAYYDDSMRVELVEEQRIVSQMDTALEQGQFALYLQPQYDCGAKKIHGAEVLVRWIHPQRGVMSPDSFIPMFERNGFISKLDEYIWRQACRLLRSWLDADKPVIPLSVNVSRRDIYNPNLCEIFEGLMKEYRLPHSLLRLEITESAYTENTDQLIQTVNSLRAAGFSVEMDDFGSGYSSLSALREVPIDVLKLDMKFFGDGDGGARGGSILSSVIRMANWIDLPVIAEGVETKEQAEYLRSVGCACMQGYYYAKPMSVTDFELLLAKESIEEDPGRRFSTNIEGSTNFLSASAQSVLLFNSFVGGAAIVEYDGGNVEVLRLNDRYLEELGTTREEYAQHKLHLLERLDGENRSVFLKAVRQAISTGEESHCEVQSLPLEGRSDGLWTSVHMRLLARAETRSILYLSVENISYRVQLATRLQSIMDGVPGGILDFEKTDRPRITYFNHTTASMFGYGNEEYRKKVERAPLAMVHPDDFLMVRTKVREMLDDDTQATEVTYRHQCADGGWRWVRLRSRVTRRQGDSVFASGVLTDVDDEVKAQKLASRQTQKLDRQRVALRALYDTIPCGVMQFAADTATKGVGGLVDFNDTAWRIFGYGNRSQYVESIHAKSKFKDVHPDDLAELERCISGLFEAHLGEKASCDHRVIRQDGSVRWVRSLLQRVRFPGGGDEMIQSVFTDVTEQKQEDAGKLVDVLFELYDEIFEFDAETNDCRMLSAKNPDDPRIGVFVSFEAHLDTLCDRYVTPDDRDRVRNFYETIRRGGYSVATRTIEYRYTSSDGDERWASASIAPVGGGRYLTCNRDITDRREAEMLHEEADVLRDRIDAERKELERVRILVDSAGMLIYDYDFASDTLRIQRSSSKEGEEEVTRRYRATLSENAAIGFEDRSRIGDLIDEASQTSGLYTIVYHGNRFGGGFRLCRAHLVVACDVPGGPRRIVGLISPAEEGSEFGGGAPSRVGSRFHGEDLNRYAHILCGLFDEVLEFDFGSGSFSSIASKHSSLLPAYGASDLDGALKQWLTLLPDGSDRERLADFLQLDHIGDLFRRGIVPTIDYTVISSQGAKRRCRTTLLRLDGKRYLCCNKDITGYGEWETLRAQVEDLERSLEEQDRYRIAADQTGIAIIDMNYETDSFFSTKTYDRYEFSKYDPHDVFTNAFDGDLVQDDDLATFQSFFAEADRGVRSASVDLRLKMSDGSYHWTRMGGSFIRSKQGDPLRVIGTLTDIDREVNARFTSAQLADRLKRIVDNIAAGVIIYEMEPRSLPVYASDRACELLGYTREECDLRIANAQVVGFEPDEGMLSEEEREELQNGKPVVIDRFYPQGAVGGGLWFRVLCSLSEEQDGRLLCYAVITDITGEVKREQEHLWKAEKYRLLSESADTITFDYAPDDDTMRVSLMMSDGVPMEEAIECYLANFIDNRRIIDKEKPGFQHALRSACRKAKSGVYDFEGEFYPGERCWYRARYTSLADEQGHVYRVVGRLDDISDIMHRQNQLRASAHIDKVSGTHNKNYALSMITETLKRKSPERLDAAFFLDIDNFKSLNDTYGHLEADHVLKQVGEILQSLFREDDIIARFGGDEFVVYMKNLKNSNVITTKAREIVRRIGEIGVNDEHPVRCSAGAACVVGEGMDYDTVLGRVDEALYRAKDNGKNGYVIYDDYAL